MSTAADITVTVTGSAPASAPLHWRACSARGPRRLNADAVASYTDPMTGRTAFALADGIGDDPSAARAAQLASAAAVRAAAGGAHAALAAAADAVKADPTAGDCVLVVAVPRESGLDIAWVGDPRAYLVGSDTALQVTTDHTLAQYFRERGEPTAPHMEHLVTTSVRTAAPTEYGRVVVERPEVLVLVSDGVYGRIDPASMARTVHTATDPAVALVRAATAAQTRDNATALVVTFPAMPTAAIPIQRVA
jgi:protein phosphatase